VAVLQAQAGTDPATVALMCSGLSGEHVSRVSSETSFVSKQPKLVSALSETRLLFRLFRFNIETGSFDVSKQPKQTKDQPKQQQFC
jgi:hypothetical protein